MKISFKIIKIESEKLKINLKKWKSNFFHEFEIEFFWANSQNSVKILFFSVKYLIFCDSNEFLFSIFKNSQKINFEIHAQIFSWQDFIWNEIKRIKSKKAQKPKFWCRIFAGWLRVSLRLRQKIKVANFKLKKFKKSKRI